MVSGAERRRYPRMFLIGAAELRAIIGAEIRWNDSRISRVVDLSFLGAAVENPKSLDLHRDQIVEIDLMLKGQDPLRVVGRVVRADEKVIALEFAALPLTARRGLALFLNDQTLGFHLRPVNPLFFDKHQNFSQWFHGPNDTNLFIWREGSKIVRAVFEAYNEVLFFEGQDLYVGKSRDHLELPTEDYAYNVLNDAARAPLIPGAPIEERAREILAQAQQRHPELKELLEILGKPS